MKQIHQNQKPVDLITKILNIHSKENDLVFDPFIGSGTTAVACHRLKRHYIGFELDKEYFDLANKRLKAEKSQITIFDL